MRHLHGGLRAERRDPLPAVHARLPREVHRRLAAALLHLPVVHGARRLRHPLRFHRQREHGPRVARVQPRRRGLLQLSRRREPAMTEA